MAQANVVDEQDQQSGSALVNELINSHEAFLTNHMGSSAPTYRDAGTIWIDNSANPWQVYMYDGTDDVLLFSFNTSTNTVNYEMSELTTSGGGSGQATIRDAFNSVDLVQFNEGGPIDFLANGTVNFKDIVTMETTANVQGRLNVENDLAPVALVNRTGSTNDAELEIQDGDGSKHSLIRRASANRLDITNNADTNLLEIDDGGDITIPNGSLTVSGGNLNFSTNSISNITQISFADTDSDGNTWSVQEDSSGNLEVNHGEFGSPIVVNQDRTVENLADPNSAQDAATKSYVDSVDASSGKEVFTSDGTFTVPSGVSEVLVTIAAGGGGGGGGSSDDGGNGGGGGGAGAIIINRRITVNAGNNISVTVGSGGSGGTSEGDGSNGGDSSFKGITATGGLGGGGAANGTNGSGGSEGDPPYVSSSGSTGSEISGGDGGDSMYGDGGSGGSSGSIGNNGSGFATGGGGGGPDATTDGGDGADGIVIVQW